MSVTIAQQVQRRRIRPKTERTTGAADLVVALQEMVDSSSRIKWPSLRYRDDPVGFARDILGVEVWSKQIELLEALRDHPRVAVRSGHKVSKSNSAVIGGLWFFSSFEDARVVMSSTTARQVDQILWRELQMVRSRGAKCVACKKADPEDREIERPCPHSAWIDGRIGELARTGLKSLDFREIVGFTAKEAEAVAGISGKNLLYILDEASGIPDVIFEAIEGNRAGGARVLLLSNPTKTSGEFFDAFHSKSRFYHTIQISSEETPNVVEGRDVIPGLATRAWIEEKKEEWGEDSPLYKVRIKGEFATREDGKIFSIHTIEQAQQRWYETPDSGRLYIGLDPAGETGSGDESAFCIRRGLKQIELVVHRGLNDDAHLIHLLTLINKHRLPREIPVVVLDREGSIGASLYGSLRNFSDTNKNSFELVAVRASDRAVRQPFLYDRMRDELTANLESWIRDGGAILEDGKLHAEMHEFEWKQQVNGRLKTTPKDKLKKALGRSPDRYDALALSVWEPMSIESRGSNQMDEPQDEDPGDGGRGLDPYSGIALWQRGD